MQSQEFGSSLVCGRFSDACVCRLSEDDGDLAELLVDHGDRKTGKELAKEFCRPMCDTGKQEL